MSKKKQQFDETRAKLLRLARAAFAEQGYAEAATNDLVAKAGMTRGALYYQFRDKRDLFQAVVVEAHKEIASEIQRAAATAPDAWAALILGCKTFIVASARPEFRRIVLVDAPAVLGWAEWRKIDAAHGMGLLLGMLEECARAGHLRDGPLLPLAHLIAGALNEAALMLAERPDDVEAGRGTAQAIDRLLGGLRRARA